MFTYAEFEQAKVKVLSGITCEQALQQKRAKPERDRRLREIEEAWPIDEGHDYGRYVSTNSWFGTIVAILLFIMECIGLLNTFRLNSLALFNGLSFLCLVALGGYILYKVYTNHQAEQADRLCRVKNADQDDSWRW